MIVSKPEGETTVVPIPICECPSVCGETDVPCWIHPDEERPATDTMILTHVPSGEKRTAHLCLDCLREMETRAEVFLLYGFIGRL